MSRKEKRKSGKKREATPVTAAGLIRFYDEDISNIKISPPIVIFISILIMALVLLAQARILPV